MNNSILNHVQSSGLTQAFFILNLWNEGRTHKGTFNDFLKAPKSEQVVVMQRFFSTFINDLDVKLPSEMESKPCQILEQEIEKVSIK